ncbi:MAG: MYG1 family protein [Clostridia bacterium]|nr:MYG1 family protein [Clostridia bacterium]
MKQLKRVGTHDGKFHADEVMATAILKEIFDIELVRTRDLEVLSKLDIVYDVGDGEFDHHQNEKEYRETGTPYAACGLIWRKFGRDVLKFREPSSPEEEIEEVFQSIDAALIEGIDASDNGLKTYRTIIPTPNISSIIAGFNPPWHSDISEDEAFNEAVEVATATLKNTINQHISDIKARAFVIEAYNNRIRPELVILERNYPWAHTLADIDTENEVLFVIYPRGEEYLIQTVRGNNGAYFGDRKKLPLSWAGKRDGELCAIIGIDDAVFCHSARFIAGAKSMESILKMAHLAIAEPEEVVELPEDVAVHGFMAAIKKLLLSKKVVIRR